uniref:IS66 family transposase n=1 Tax=Sphingobacterium cavernae TaxID=2592657 RepID=UPI003742B939
MSACPEDIVEHSPGFCNCCGLDLQDFQAELTSCRQMVDIPLTKPLYTEHRIFSKTCLCGHQTTASFPSGVNAPISYGPKTTALIAYLHTRQYVPLARISEFFNSVYSMPISQGTVIGILDRFAKKSLPALELIKQTICKSTVVGADETGMKQNGQLNWFWTWQNKLATYIACSANRGIATIKEHFPAGFPKVILVHDCWPSHLNTEAAGHQICTAHLLRELKFLEQKYQSEWATQFSRMLILALELKKSIPVKFKIIIKEFFKFL